ncbi:MAG TPA: RusA family crossover junction endodeoxyribonuclease [Longimicrobium sp.]|nr:RusA family crossover junction endodeoxyribonuclease [Longimicrobium sp.]
MTVFDFVIARRPVSVQTENRVNYQAWKRFVRNEAGRGWGDRPSVETALRLTVVFLCDEALTDTDNVIKPIQDALEGLVYADDVVVADVDCHRRVFSDPVDLARVPAPLAEALIEGKECVYVRVMPAQPLEEMV